MQIKLISLSIEDATIESKYRYYYTIHYKKHNQQDDQTPGGRAGAIRAGSSYVTKYRALPWSTWFGGREHWVLPGVKVSLEFGFGLFVGITMKLEPFFN
jgi:hypothetical protein